MGGSDTYGSTVVIAEALKTVSDHIKIIHFFLGPSFQHQDELKEILVGINYDYQLHCCPSCLHEELDKMDVVICGGGMTLFEAAAMGLPMLAFANEYHEEDNIDYLIQAGGCRTLGCIHHTSPGEIASALSVNLLDDSLLNSLSRKARKAIRLDGTIAVTKEALNLMEQCCFTLRQC